MPVGSCKCFDKNLQECLNRSDETDEGYFFSVELEYRRHLHDLHNWWMKIFKITDKMLFSYQTRFNQMETKIVNIM